MKKVLLGNLADGYSVYLGLHKSAAATAGESSRGGKECLSLEAEGAKGCQYKQLPGVPAAFRWPPEMI